MTNLRLGTGLLLAAFALVCGPACVLADEADTQARPREAQTGRQRLAPHAATEGPVLMGVPGYDSGAAPARGSAQGLGPLSSNPLFGAAPVPAGSR
jgi:hypothetical protein